MKSAVVRKIIHIDMDAFFASVEQRDFPELRGKPLAVGGSPGGRGVVAAASYEARAFGVRSAMPSHKALQLCPHLIFVKPRFEIYKQVSSQIREIFRNYTDIIEPLSLDEAYLDVTVDKKGVGSALEIASRIRAEIHAQLGLTASAGVSVNKFVAKVASDLNKPNGITFIGPSKIEAFMEQLPVEKFFGVGKVTAKKMQERGLFTGLDLKKKTEHELIQFFGKQGRFFYRIVRGVDERAVQPHRVSKSIGVEDTFAQDITSIDELVAQLEVLVKKLAFRLHKNQLRGRTITLKIRFHDFSIMNRSRSLATPIDNETDIFEMARGLLLKELAETEWKIRLLGVSASNFIDTDLSQNLPAQLRLNF